MIIGSGKLNTRSHAVPSSSLLRTEKVHLSVLLLRMAEWLRLIKISFII